MKLPKKQTHRKKIIIAIAAIIVVLLGFGVWYMWLRPTVASGSNRPVNTVNYGSPTAVEQNVGNDQKTHIVQQQKNQNSATTSQSLQIIIVRTFQDPTGFNLRTQINGTTSGECSITLTQPGKQTITKTFPVVFEATSANCQNTPIPLNDFSSGGTWNVSVTVKNGSAQSTPATVSADIKT